MGGVPFVLSENMVFSERVGLNYGTAMKHTGSTGIQQRERQRERERYIYILLYTFILYNTHIHTHIYIYIWNKD